MVSNFDFIHLQGADTVSEIGVYSRLILRYVLTKAPGTLRAKSTVNYQHFIIKIVQGIR